MLTILLTNYMRSGEKTNLPFKEVVLDGGSIIEILLREVSKIKNAIEEEIIVPVITFLGIIEAEYILYRRLGKEIAIQKIDNLLNSNFFEVISIELIRRKVSLLKSNNPIAVADCATIAVAQEKNIPALFAKKEQKLKDIMQKGNPFGISIYFIKELE